MDEEEAAAAPAKRSKAEPADSSAGDAAASPPAAAAELEEGEVSAVDWAVARSVAHSIIDCRWPCLRAWQLHRHRHLLLPVVLVS